MTLSAGTRLGPYEILSPLGAGGMGEVYKARDFRLDRFVAIKVLPPEVAADPERVRRFAQEARAASALNHPNILTVYDIGSADSISYIATELIEGKTLSDLLLHGRLPVKRLLEITAQTADGLASAHEAGIVHRDLKPGNVMITKNGLVKILDFGLAKLPTPAPKLDYDSSTSTTEPISDTAPGAIVGTVDYMSPEQACGKETDYRSDQFSFGTILYEMASGRRAFRRGTSVETLAAILNEEPEPIPKVAGFPPPLLWILDRCLAKKAQDRFSSTRDLARDIASIRDHLSEVSTQHDRSSERTGLQFLASRRGIWLLATLSVALTILLVILVRRAVPSAPAAPIRLSLLPEPGSILNFEGSASAPVAISPSGQKVVFGATDSSGRDLLWVRALGSLAPLPLSGTEGADYPFWSPDERFIGFFSDGKLRKVSSAGGPPQALCEARAGRGGTWSRQGIILFAPDSVGGIFEIPESGGDPRPVTSEKGVRTTYSHRWPSFLPDGEHFLYLVHHSSATSGENGIYLKSRLVVGARLLLRDLSNVVYASPGYLLFVRDGSLMAAPFDVRSLRLNGNPFSLGERVAYHSYRWDGAFSASSNGALAYQGKAVAGSALLAWFDRSGTRLGIVGPPGDYGGVRISRDGSQCAVELRDPSTGSIDLWIYDLKRGLSSRLTSSTTCISPVWSPAGDRIAFASNRGTFWNLYQKDPGSSSPEEVLYQAEGDKATTDWSLDGASILFNNAGTALRHKWEIWLLSLGSRKATPLLHTSFNERDGCLSPDSQLLAYVSDESGRQEVYLRPFSKESGKWRVSVSGGSRPVWRSDGAEIFYVDPHNKLLSARVVGGTRVEIGLPEELFEVPFPRSASDMPLYGVSPDGRRFLIVSSASMAGPSTITVVLNWARNLKR